MTRAFLFGLVATIAATLLYTGPLGGGARIARDVDPIAARTLRYYEMAGVSARMADAPLRREIDLSGKADDFQRRELVRIMADIPGISSARWTDRPAPAFPSRPLPLLAEAILLALGFFGLGWLVAYLAAVRQRARRWDRI